jgi:hypothetical protein
MLAMLMATSVLAGCAGAQPPSQSTMDPGETLLEPLPTLDADPGHATPPEPSSGVTPIPSLTTAAISCDLFPSFVGAGDSVTLVVYEMGDWYGTERWYMVVGVPDQQVREFQGLDGGLGPHTVMGFVVPEYLAGASLEISVEMRDWDVHAPPALPGTPSGSGRPDSTRHHWPCSRSLNVMVANAS